MNEPKVAPVMNKRMMRVFTALNVFVYRLTGGRLMNSMMGTPICLVTMTGAKSGRKRIIPLMYNPHGGDVVLVASLGGAPQNPLWYYNLLAHPEIEIQVGPVKRRMRCRQASSDEKAALWPEIVANFSSYGAYQRRTDRDIPVMICSPV
jgi:deazaflavin-dependent oxidoreductase (nitroreductase family)